MKTALKTASILSWFNLIWWSVNLIGTLPTVGRMGSFMIVALVVIASIPLNAYASLQLHKSIRHPSIKLSSQTPVGIRFVGLVAEIIGFILLLAGLVVLLNPQQLLIAIKDSQDPAFSGQLGTTKAVRLMGGFFMFLGLTVCVNVILNFRLLRWYYLVNQSDIRQSDNVRQNDES